MHWTASLPGSTLTFAVTRKVIAITLRVEDVSHFYTRRISPGECKLTSRASSSRRPLNHTTSPFDLHKPESWKISKSTRLWAVAVQLSFSRILILEGKLELSGRPQSTHTANLMLYLLVIFGAKSWAKNKNFSCYALLTPEVSCRLATQVVLKAWNWKFNLSTCRFRLVD